MKTKMMNLFKCVSLALMLMILSPMGCIVPKGIADLPAPQFGELDDWQVAVAYQYMRNGVRALYPEYGMAFTPAPSPELLAYYEDELRARGLTEREIEAAREGEIFIGMSWLGLYAAMGRPCDSNVSVGSWGRHTQYVYCYRNTVKRDYVYTENGKIRSWQF